MDTEDAPTRLRSTPYDDGAVGVYLHLPFCERICPYCDFAVVAARELPIETELKYCEALEAELMARKPDFAGRPLASLYFGGGTPSLFAPESIARLVQAVESAFPNPGPIAGGELPTPEITLELNPSTAEQARLPGFRAAGINRVSVGVQSFQDEQLKRLGRAHRGDVARSMLLALREARFDNVSIDLIFAGPGQSRADLERDLEELARFSPEHVSTYELTYEPETPFGRALADGRMRACDEDEAVHMIGQVESALGAAGFERYEISSYAKPGRRAVHNARYWQRQAVLGLGVGAHSTEARTVERPHGGRRANPRDLSTWLAAVEANPARAGAVEVLAPLGSRGEAVFLSLRQGEGLAAAAFEAEFGGAPRVFFGREIDRLIATGWLIEGDGGDLWLSPEGRLVADSVAAEFVSPPE